MTCRATNPTIAVTASNNVFQVAFLFLCAVCLASSESSSQNSGATVEEQQQHLSSADKRASLPYTSEDNFGPFDTYLSYAYTPTGLYSPEEERIMNSLRPSKRGMDDGQAMPGVLRFGKRSQSFVRFGRSMLDDDLELAHPGLTKKEMPGVLRFGKRRDMQQEKKAVPGVLRFGKRESDIPGVLRFGKRDSDMPGVLRFGKRGDMPGVLRFGKRDSDMPGVLRFGKKSEMPGVLRFGKRDPDMPGVLRFGKRSTDMPGVLRFG